MANPKSIEERVASLPDEVKNQILPTEGLPKEFEHLHGKSVADVIKNELVHKSSFNKTQAELNTANEDKEALMAEIEQLKTAPPAVSDPPGEEPGKYYPEDEYLDGATFNKALAKIEQENKANLEKVKADTKKEVVEETSNLVYAQFERRQFITAHPELFKGKTSEEQQVVINKVAAQAFNSDDKSLEGGLSAIKEMAVDLGLVKNKDGEVIVVPANLDGGGNPPPDEPEDPFTRMAEYKDKKGEWQTTSSLRTNDLTKAAAVLNKAYEYIVLSGPNSQP